MNTETDSPIDENVRLRTGVTCPHCLEQFLVFLRCSVNGVAKNLEAETEDTRHSKWLSSLSPKQAAFLDESKRSGVFDAFDHAVSSSAHAGKPSNMDKFFLNWISMAKPKLIPGWALNEFRGLYPGEFVTFIAANYVGAVLAGRTIRLFFPVSLINGVTTSTSSGVALAAKVGNATGIQQWVRTRMGYVPDDCKLALDEMRKRVIGEFANPVL